MAHLKRPKVSYNLHALHGASRPSSGFDPCSSFTTLTTLTSLTTLMTSGQVSDTEYLTGMETLRLAAAARRACRRHGRCARAWLARTPRAREVRSRRAPSLLFTPPSGPVTCTCVRVPHLDAPRGDPFHA